MESTDAMTRMDLRGLEGYFDRAVIDLQKQAVALGGRMDERPALKHGGVLVPWVPKPVIPMHLEWQIRLEGVTYCLILILNCEADR